MFSFFFDWFKPEYVTPKSSKSCRECGRKYGTIDAARTCEYWDLTLGVYRKR